MEVYVKAKDQMDVLHFEFYYENGKLIKLKSEISGGYARGEKTEKWIRCHRDPEGRLLAVEGEHPNQLPPEMAVTFEYGKQGLIVESKTPLKKREQQVAFNLVFGYYKGRLNTFSSKVDPENRGYFAYGNWIMAPNAKEGDKLSGVRRPSSNFGYVVKVSENAPKDIDLNEVGVILALF